MRRHSSICGISAASSAILRELADRRLDADDRGERVAERARVDLGAVAGDHADLLEAPHALGHRRRGQADPPAQLSEGDPAILGQFADDLPVDVRQEPASFHRRDDHNAFDCLCTCASGREHNRIVTLETASRRTRTSPEAPCSTTSGPAFAVLLFSRVAPLGVAWLRIASAAIVFAAWRRPWRTLRGADRDTMRLLVALGAVLAVMNSCFYEAIARLPLGTVSAIEFLPVIALAAFGVRSPRNVAALARGRGRRLRADRRPAARRRARVRPGLRQRRAVRALHRARAPRVAAVERSAASTGWPRRC